jgi:uncharacterized protein (TIGR02594 family)
MKLSHSQIATAAQRNPVFGRQVGWGKRYVDVLKFLGFPATCPTGEVFAQAVADWQDRHKPLTPDGIIGPNTWKKMEPEMRKSPGLIPPPPLPPAGGGPPWLQYAQAEGICWGMKIISWGKDKKRFSPEDHLDWDEKYFRASPYYGGKSHADGAMPRTVSPDWCAAFANWCLHRAGYSHTGSARAGSFLKDRLWRFDALEEPRPGCVLVCGNDGPAHVTFLSSSENLPINPRGDVRHTKDRLVLTLGGNQDNRVKVKEEKRRLIAACGRNGVTSPYLWPLVGEPTCTIKSVQSGQGHFCGIRPV